MDIKKSFRDGVFYTAIGKYSNVVIQLVITAILSRLISPAEYGIISVVNVFLVFFQILADSGIGPAIIQNKELNEHDLDNIFSITVFLGFVLAILFACLGYPISFIYQNNLYVKLCLLLGICVFFYTITIVPQSILNKSLKFKQVSLLTLCANVVSGLFAVLLAYLGFGVYTLIFSNIVKALAIFILLYYQVSLKFYFKIEKNSFLKIFDFAKFQFLSNFLNYFARNLDNLLIGSIFSPTVLGYYDKAYQLSLYPNQILTQVITPAIHPIMSNFSDDKDRMSNVFLKVSNVMITIGLPISTFLVTNSKDIILFMFGENWLPSVDTFRILSSSIWLQMANSFLGTFYQATNNTRALFKVGVVTSFINIIAIFLGIILGSIEAIAWTLLFSFCIVLFITLFHLQRIIPFTYTSYAKPIIINGIILLPYIFIIYLLRNIQFGLLFNIIIKATLLIFVWGCGIFVTGSYKNFLYKEE